MNEARELGGQCARLNKELVDDLWETGSTLRRVAEVLGQMGASEIWALAMTRTK
jgi:predicted amidophosphoribosyltransferase